MEARWCSVLLLVFFTLFSPGVTVKREGFKTCDQSGFCKRNRAYADAASSLGSSWKAPYRLLPESIKFQNGRLDGVVLKDLIQDGSTVRLPLTITFLKSGLARVTLDEEKRVKGEIELRHNSQARKERYNEAASWAIVGGLDVSTEASVKEEKDNDVIRIVYGPSGSFEAVIRFSPFSIDFKRDGETHVQFNDKGFMNVEHWRAKKDKGDAETEVENAEDESTWWEESFGGNTDTKPKGPESVALDITFPGYEHVFGIPEHAGPLALKETRGGDGQYTDPYRMYNSDVFEYELDSPMTLYGAIPLMQAHRKGSTVAVFWLNAAETWVDITRSKSSTNPLSLGITGKTTTQTHWFSEAGLLDVFVFLGPTPKDIVRSYSELTGYSQLPPEFSIGYHQCRWNYITDQDVKDVDRKFDRYQIPYDVIWLDLEYTDDRKYFTWDPLTFIDPEGMQNELAKRQRKVVVLIDPHIKNVANYHVVDELKSKGIAIRNKDGNIYEGWCWPGSSHWVDCFNPEAIKWWIGLFKYDSFKGSTPNLFVWNDMNEPSVFNGPETTSPKDNLHYGNWENRDLHNINGMTFVNATYHALIERKKGEPRRPFVLTRSFYAGSQRLGAMWTGDNLANWGHLAASIPMCLSMSISGYSFVGADVGGFFGNPSKELLTRWYQAGIFYPFFRAHAHIDTARREPYLIGEPYTGIITRAMRLRYQLLPAWYTAFHETSTDGSPILRPQFYMFPDDEKGFTIDDQFYIGSTGLLAKPVTAEGVNRVDIHLADSETYYDYFDFTIHRGPGRVSIAAPLDKIPLLMQAGHIIPRRDRPRRSSGLMKFDPITLLVVLNKTHKAEGTLYLDDGETFDYQQGAYIHRRFSMDGKTLTSSDLSTPGPKTAPYLKTMKDVRIERIILVGAPSEWSSKDQVKIFEEHEAEAKGSSGNEWKANVQYHPAKDGKATWTVIRDPGVRVGREWKIDFSS